MSESPNYQLITIELETIYGENPTMDEVFNAYLDEYSIAHKVLETDSPTEWPILQYTGGPISLSNMLQERFGYTQEEIKTSFPQLFEALN